MFLSDTCSIISICFVILFFLEMPRYEMLKRYFATFLQTLSGV